MTQLAIAQQNVGRIKTAIEKARDAMCRNVITEDDYMKQKRAYDEQLVGLGEQIKKLEELAPASIIPLARATLELANCCAEQYKSMNWEEKRQLLDSVCSNFLLDGKSIIPEWRKPFQQVAEMALCPNWLPESDAHQNRNGLLFEFPFGQLNTTKGEKRLLPRKSFHDETDTKIRRPKTWTIKDRLALAQECRRKLLAFPELSRKAIAEQLGFTVVRLNQIMELLKLAPAIQNRIMKLSPATDARFTEETLREIAAFADPKQQWLRLRGLD